MICHPAAAAPPPPLPPPRFSVSGFGTRRDPVKQGSYLGLTNGEIAHMPGVGLGVGLRKQMSGPMGAGCVFFLRSVLIGRAVPDNLGAKKKGVVIARRVDMVPLFLLFLSFSLLIYRLTWNLQNIRRVGGGRRTKKNEEKTRHLEFLCLGDVMKNLRSRECSRMFY